MLKWRNYGQLKYGKLTTFQFFFTYCYNFVTRPFLSHFLLIQSCNIYIVINFFFLVVSFSRLVCISTQFRLSSIFFECSGMWCSTVTKCTLHIRFNENLNMLLFLWIVVPWHWRIQLYQSLEMKVEQIRFNVACGRGSSFMLLDMVKLHFDICMCCLSHTCAANADFPDSLFVAKKKININ